ncbi:MAG: hypothetical protein NTY33_01355 [Candidatus Moranbacteria bacterium]|nr:hypothetical protein [Candidatus Moranbacteria bacterium]
MVLQLVNSGNVGIGTTGPGAKTHIYVSDTSSQQLLIQNAVADYTTGNPGIGFQVVSGLQTGKIYSGFVSPGTWDKSFMRFQVPNSGGTLTDTMTLTNGNVGIGTTAPWSALSIPWSSKLSFGSVTYPFDIYRLASGQLPIYFDDTYNNDLASINFRMKTSGTPVNAMTILGSGNVGIGTTGPGAKLEVLNTSVSAVTYPLLVTNVGGSNNGSGVGIQITNTRIGAGDYSLNLGTFGNLSALTIRSGNVGIGTTTLTAGLLTVFSAAGNQLVLQKTGDAPALGFGGATVPTGLIEGLSGGGFTFYRGSGTWASPTWNSVMKIDNSGNVGIGTASPGAKLDVAGTQWLTGTTSTNYIDFKPSGTQKAIIGMAGLKLDKVFHLCRAVLELMR